LDSLEPDDRHNGPCVRIVAAKPGQSRCWFLRRPAFGIGRRLGLWLESCAA
jgi:hypothetical protein